MAISRSMEGQCYPHESSSKSPIAKYAFPWNSSSPNVDANFAGSHPPHQDAVRYTTALPPFAISALSSCDEFSFATDELMRIVERSVCRRGFTMPEQHMNAKMPVRVRLPTSMSDMVALVIDSRQQKSLV